MSSLMAVVLEAIFLSLPQASLRTKVVRGQRAARKTGEGLTRMLGSEVILPSLI